MDAMVGKDTELVVQWNSNHLLKATQFVNTHNKYMEDAVSVQTIEDYLEEVFTGNFENISTISYCSINFTPMLSYLENEDVVAVWLYITVPVSFDEKDGDTRGFSMPFISTPKDPTLH